MFAVVESGGKQYKVSPGEKIKVEKLESKVGEKHVFDKVLLKVKDGGVEIGQPWLKSGVEAKILKQARYDKKIVFRYHSKTRYRKKKGARQAFTELEISHI